MNQCPNCNSEHLATGKIVSSRGIAVFQPAGVRVWSMSLFGGIEFTEEAFACLECRFAAGFTSPSKLRDIIEKHCD